MEGELRGHAIGVKAEADATVEAVRMQLAAATDKLKRCTTHPCCMTHLPAVLYHVYEFVHGCRSVQSMTDSGHGTSLGWGKTTSNMNPHICLVVHAVVLGNGAVRLCRSLRSVHLAHTYSNMYSIFAMQDTCW